MIFWCNATFSCRFVVCALANFILFLLGGGGAIHLNNTGKFRGEESKFFENVCNVVIEIMEQFSSYHLTLQRSTVVLFFRLFTDQRSLLGKNGKAELCYLGLKLWHFFVERESSFSQIILFSSRFAFSV